jgi:phage tail-like protein
MPKEYNKPTGADTSTLSRWSKLSTDPIRNFRFIVTFSASVGDTADKGPAKAWKDFTVGGFTQIGGLNINTQAIPYREGGMNTTMHQVPGMTSFQPITLQRGVIWGNTQGINWMRMLFAAAAAEGITTGTASNNYRCDITIYVLDHPGVSASYAQDVIQEQAYRMKFTIHNAWITNLSYNDLNASDNQLMYETMQIVHEGMTVSHVQSGN